MSKKTEVGWFEGRSPITVEREPEVAIMWMATAEHFNQAALGRTADEAVRNLVGVLNERGISGRGHSDSVKLATLDRQTQ